MKRKIPLEILELFQPHINKNKDYVVEIKNLEVIFHIIDKSEDSKFFFKVVRQEIQNSKIGYTVEFYPRNKQDVSIYKTWLQANQIPVIFDSWLDLIKAYNSIQTIHDDPILMNNQKRFEKEFDIIDEDADISSFNLEQQIYLNNYIDFVKEKILYLKANKPTQEISELNDLENEASLIQKNLTKESKKQIIKRLSKLWGKAQVIGLDVIKEIFVNVVADITKKLLTGS